MRIDFVAALATSTVTNAALPHGAAASAAPAASAGDVFAQLLAALGQAAADTSVAAALAAVEPKNADPSPGKFEEHAATNPPGQTLHNMPAEPHAAKPGNPGEVVSDSAKPLTKTSTASGTPLSHADKDVPDNDPNPAPVASTLVAQLLAPVQPAPCAPRPPQAPPANAEPTAAMPAGILPAVPTDAIASGIGQSGTAAKPAPDPSGDETASKPDSVKSQSPSSSANALAALSTAANHTFGDASTVALSVHTDGGNNNSNGSGSNRQSNNPHPHSSEPVSDVRVAPQATFADGSTPTNPPAPPAQSDNNALAAAAAPNPQAPNVQPAQFHATLQVGPAPAHAAPDIGALALTIAAKSQDGIKHFDIRLDPPELGKVDVRLTVDDTGKAQASLAVEKPQTLELLQKDSNSLERALKDAGLDLSQNGLNFSLKGQQQQSGNGDPPSSRNRTLNATAVAAIDAAPTTASTSGVGASDTRLDITV